MANSDHLKLKAELDEVQKRLERYESATYGGSEGLWDKDLTTGKVFISPSWLSMLGHSQVEGKEVEGLWQQWMHPDDRERTMQHLEAYLEGEIAVYDIDFRLKHKNGHYLWVRSKAKIVKDDHGIPLRISGNHTDITEKKIAAQRLAKSEKKYKNLFENALIGMMRIRAKDLFITEINKRGLQILAMPQFERRLKVEDLLVDKSQLQDIFELLKVHNGLEEYELKVIRWDESEVWLSISAVYFEEGGSKFFDIIFKDVTEFKENLLELQRLNFELDNFVYHASHDIRSPLRSIMGLVDILRSEKNPAEIQKIIDMISGSINRLDKFVVDLLSMSRNNRVIEEAVEVNFMVEINNGVTNFFHVYDTVGLDIRVLVHQAVPFFSDLAKIRIILNNIISNAIKYRKTTDRVLSYIHINVEVNEKEAILVVEDNGEGISEDKLHKIFDMFYRASENSEGSGLGMYIVKNVIIKLEANIDVKSEDRKGTTFTIKIPNVYSGE